MKLKGKVIKRLDVQSGVSKAGNEWKKQDLVMSTGNDFNPEVCVTFFGEEKIAMIEGLSAGSEIEVSVNISSRAWKDRYFHSIDGWKVDLMQDEGIQTVDKLDNLDDDNGLPF